MGVAMDREYRTIVDESFGITFELAWSSAKEMLETVKANPVEFSA